jgi:hypothetical protein
MVVLSGAVPSQSAIDSSNEGTQHVVVSANASVGRNAPNPIGEATRFLGHQPNVVEFMPRKPTLTSELFEMQHIAVQPVDRRN